MPPLPPADLEHILDHTRDLWADLRGQGIFVTGGTGFFGRWLLESFAHANTRLALRARLTYLTRDPAAFAAKAPHLAADSALQAVSGDVKTLARDHSGRFPFIIHAATESGSTLGRDNPLAMFETVVDGARSALEFAVAAGTRRFLFTSSGAVYGPQPPDLTHLPETYRGAPDPAQPSSAYGEGKRAAELLCACYRARHPDLEPVIARCFAFVGPGLPLDAHFAIGNFIRDALRGGPLRIGGDGTPYRSYLYAADLAIWLWTLLFRGEPNLPYNVGSAHGLNIETLARLVASHAPSPCPVEIAIPRQPGQIPARYVPDVTRIKQQLKVSENFTLDEVVERTLSFHRSIAR